MRRQWWQRSRGLPAEVFSAWRQDPRAGGVLAWARTSTGYAVASAGSFAYGDSDGFVHLGWQEIERGGWNAETRRLSWTLYPGGPARRHGHVEVEAAGRLPEVFRERVAASLVLEQFAPLEPDGERGVVITARRDPTGDGSPLTWHSTLTRGVTWQTPGVSEFAESALSRMRAEWDGP